MNSLNPSKATARFVKAALVVLMMPTFIGCTVNSESERGKGAAGANPFPGGSSPVPGVPSPKGNEEPDGEGTFVLGGGNGADICSPLEKCRFRPMTDPLTAEVFKNVLGVLEQKSMAFAEEVRRLINGRAWYLGPSGLKVIPSARLGVSFKTHQLALHSRWEIWIDRAAFLKLQPDEQGLLMVHEALMALIVEKRAQNSDRANWLEIPAAKDLSEEEHQVVRLLTSDLIGGAVDSMTPRAFVARLDELGFKGFAPSVPGVRLGFRFSPEQLMDYLGSKAIAGELPQRGQVLASVESEKVEGSCGVTSTAVGEKAVQLRMQFASALRSEDLTFKSTEASVQFSSELGPYLEFHEAIEKPKLGSLRRILKIIFAADGSINYRLHSEIYVFDPQALDSPARGFQWRAPSRGAHSSVILCQAH